MIPKFYGDITNGKLTVYDEEGYRGYLSNLSGEVEIQFKRKTRKRTNPQNNWYWGVAVKLTSEHTGYTPLEVHNVFKSMFLKDILIINNREVEIVKSTTELDTKGFSQDYWQRIQCWCADELNLNVPSPDEVYV